MANLSVKEIIAKGYITDVSVASALLSGDLKSDDPIVQGSITKVADWQDTYGDETPGVTTSEEEKAQADVKAKNDLLYVDNKDNSDNVTFKVGTTDYTFAGEPEIVSAKKALAELGIKEPLYVDGVLFNTKGKKAIDLQGLTFTTKLVAKEGDDNTPTDGGETTSEPEGDTTGE